MSNSASRKVVFRFPAAQRVTLTVGVGFMSAVLVIPTLVLPWPAWLVSALFLAPMVPMLIRFQQVEWRANSAGLVSESYVWKTFIPVASIRRVMVQSAPDRVLVEGDDGSGLDMPTGTSQTTRTSKKRAHELGAELAELWEVECVESNPLGIDNFGMWLSKPTGSMRRSAVTREDVVATAVILGIYGIVLAVVHS